MKYLGATFNIWQNIPNKDDLTTGNITAIILAVTSNLIALSGGVCLIFILWGAIRYITSAGNPSSAADARNVIINALVGLIIVAGAFAFVRYLINTILV